MSQASSPSTTPTNPPGTFTQADWKILRKGPSVDGGNVTVTLNQSTRKPGPSELANTPLTGTGKYNWGYQLTGQGKITPLPMVSETRYFLRKDGSVVTVQWTVDEDLMASPLPMGPVQLKESWEICSDYPDKLAWQETIKDPNVRVFTFSFRDIWLIEPRQRILNVMNGLALAPEGIADEIRSPVPAT